jgi:alginate O-acetyltransferase complex protein AlgI
VIGATPLLKILIEKLKEKNTIKKIINLAEPIAMVLLMIVVTSYLVAGSYNPFLYFRF